MREDNFEKAIRKLRECLKEMFGTEIELYLFGSVARKQYEILSDIDILVLIPGKIDNSIEEEIFGLAYEVELEFDVVFGIIVYSKEFWHSDLTAVMPLYRSIQEESIKL